MIQETPLRACLRLVLSTALALLLAACASTPKLTASWRDPQFTGPAPAKLLVLGISRSDVHRRVFEDGFAGALRAAGVGGVPAYTELPEQGVIPDERIQAAVKKTGAEAVLTARVIRVDRQVEVRPGMPPPMPYGPYGRGFHGWYGSAWTMSQPDIVQYDVVTIESTLWDMRSNKLVWSGTSETTQTSDVAKLTEGLSKVLIAKMKTDGVL